MLGGLSSLIPMPLLDEWARGVILRRMVRELSETRELELSDADVGILVGAAERRAGSGLVMAAVRQGGAKVLRKLFKTAFYVLLIREGVHRSAEIFLQGYLLLYAARLPAGLKPAGRTEERVRAVREAILATTREADVAPVRKAIGRAFRRSFSLLFQVTGLLADHLGRLRSRRESPPPDADLREEEELLGGFVDKLAASLWGNQEYFEALEKDFAARLGR